MRLDVHFVRVGSAVVAQHRRVLLRGEDQVLDHRARGLHLARDAERNRAAREVGRQRVPADEALPEGLAPRGRVDILEAIELETHDVRRRVVRNHRAHGLGGDRHRAVHRVVVDGVVVAAGVRHLHAGAVERGLAESEGKRLIIGKWGWKRPVGVRRRDGAGAGEGAGAGARRGGRSRRGGIKRAIPRGGTRKWGPRARADARTSSGRFVRSGEGRGERTCGSPGGWSGEPSPTRTWAGCTPWRPRRRAWTRCRPDAGRRGGW